MAPASVSKGPRGQCRGQAHGARALTGRTAIFRIATDRHERQAKTRLGYTFAVAGRPPARAIASV
jgi:hypothetical protein